MRTKPWRRQKYNAKPTEYRGWRFDSKAEADYARGLDARKDAGEIIFWLRQIPVDLTEDDRYRLDFLVVESSGELYGVDVKGMETKSFKRVVRLWQRYAPFPLHVVYRDRVAIIPDETQGE